MGINVDTRYRYYEMLIFLTFCHSLCSLNYGYTILVYCEWWCTIYDNILFLSMFFYPYVTYHFFLALLIIIIIKGHSLRHTQNSKLNLNNTQNSKLNLTPLTHYHSIWWLGDALPTTGDGLQRQLPHVFNHKGLWLRTQNGGAHCVLLLRTQLRGQRANGIQPFGPRSSKC